jgi:hypothetical protein
LVHPQHVAGSGAGSLAHGSARYLERRGREFAAVMARDHRRAGTTTEGTWYERKDHEPAS